MVAVETICTEKKQLFINICLYSQKITRRIEEIFEDVKSNQQNQMKNLQHLSINRYRSVWNIISGMFSNFDIFEDFLCLIPLKATTTGEHILS